MRGRRISVGCCGEIVGRQPQMLVMVMAGVMRFFVFLIYTVSKLLAGRDI